jgi:Mg2+/Co2+ transporter CorC
MGDEETNRLLRQNLEMAKENNGMLRSMRRSQRWHTAITMVYWAIIIGLPVYLYYIFIRPVVGDISDVYSGVAEGIENVQKVPGGFAGIMEKIFGSGE